MPARTYEHWSESTDGKDFAELARAALRELEEAGASLR